LGLRGKKGDRESEVLFDKEERLEVARAWQNEWERLVSAYPGFD